LVLPNGCGRRLDSLPKKPSRRGYSAGNPCRPQKSLRKV